MDGVTVRFPFDARRTFRGGAPVARVILAPPAIDARTQPVLRPPSARKLIVYRACALEASRGGMKDPSFFHALEQQEWIGNPLVPGSIGILGNLKKQYQQNVVEYETGHILIGGRHFL